MYTLLLGEVKLESGLSSHVICISASANSENNEKFQLKGNLVETATWIDQLTSGPKG